MPKTLKPDVSAIVAPRLDSVFPSAALPGADVHIHGANLGPVGVQTPQTSIGGKSAHVLLSRYDRLVVRVPEDSLGARIEVSRNGVSGTPLRLEVAELFAENVHAVASPAANAKGDVFVTFSGPRGQQTPVSIFRIDRDAKMHVLLTGLMNATGLALDSAGYLYVSSRHDGTVHRVSADGAAAVYAEGMGIATGLAFDAEQNLYVGDRSGTIFKIARDRQTFVFATLEPSVAAYHLAFGRDNALFVTGPTTSTYDNIYRIDRDGSTAIYYRGLGRPQGLAVDRAGNLYVAASLKGRRGIVRITPAKEASLVLAGSGIVGITFAPGGIAVLTTANAVYKVDLGVEGLQIT